MLSRLTNNNRENNLDQGLCLGHGCLLQQLYHIKQKYSLVLALENVEEISQLMHRIS
jgi:hypothetical protein